MSSISINHVSKSYETVHALNDISLDVKKGELFGLIGPDGAGKTTLFRILTTLLLPDEGTATVEGLSTVTKFREIRDILGYMPGRFSLYQDLSVQENLAFFASVFNTSIKENYHLIRDIYVQLEPFKDRSAGKLSGGMKQKLALCCALIHKPQVLFLDEPTTGVDPVSRKEFWEMLKRLKAENITIMVSTPYMDEAMLCDRIALMFNGKILDIDTPANIIQKFPQKLYAFTPQHSYHTLEELRRHENVASVYAFGDSLHITLKNEQALLSGYTLEQIQPTIEDCFMLLTKKENDKVQQTV